MLMSNSCDINKYQILYESIYPAVIAAIVTLLGIFVQLYVGKNGNNMVIQSIIKTKKIESYMQFYRPLKMLLNEITIFFENYEEFEFCKERYLDINYYGELRKLQNIYDKICNWCDDNYINMYPENEELDTLISKIYNHMRNIIPITEDDPESWNILSKYNRDNILLIVNNIKLEINKITYK